MNNEFTAQSRQCFQAMILDQSAGRGDPPRVPAHHLNDEHLGRGFAHGAHVERRFEHRHRHVFCDRADAGAAIGKGQIVVCGFGHWIDCNG
jgi:hypothetical protein